MDKLSWDRFKFGAPVSHVFAVLIVIIRLFDNIETIQLSTGHARGVTPIVSIRINVVISTHAPIVIQVNFQEASHILSPTVRHEARSCQLSHVGVHQGIARATSFPGLQALVKRRPFLMLADGATGKKDLVAIFETKEITIITPRAFQRRS